MALTSQCYEATDAGEYDLEKLYKLSLEDKILWSRVQIKKFYLAMKGKTYVSFSGGKDSTVLLDLVRQEYPDTPAVFIDTGLEYPEIREFVRTIPNVTWLKPAMSFRKVIDTYGYPMISKNTAKNISLAQRGWPAGLLQLESDGPFSIKRYKNLVYSEYKVSEKCCDIMKKNPAKAYNKETGRAPYIGVKADDSKLRAKAFRQRGANDTRGGARPSRAIPSSSGRIRTSGTISTHAIFLTATSMTRARNAQDVCSACSASNPIRIVF